MRDCFVKRLGRPTRADAERLSDQVIETAGTLFATRGYAETSIAAVASAARVGKHTIYRRFPDKAELFRAVIDRNAEAFLGSDELPPERGTGLERTRGLLERAARLGNSSNSAWLYRIALAEAQRFPELASVVMDSAGLGLIDRLTPLVSGAQADGDIPDGDPHEISRLALGMVAAPFLVGRLSGIGIDDEVQFRVDFDRVWAIFIAGVGIAVPAMAATGGDRL